MGKLTYSPVLFIAALTIAQAQEDSGFKYHKERLEGDLAALPYRRELERLSIGSVHKQFKITMAAVKAEMGSGLTISFAPPFLQIHPRMIGKYGKGRLKAFQVVPAAAARLTELHALLRILAWTGQRPLRLRQILDQTKEIYPDLSEKEIVALALSAAQTSRFYLDFWGYYSQTPRLPSARNGVWTYYLRTNTQSDDFVDPGELIYPDMIGAILLDIKRPGGENGFWRRLEQIYRNFLRDLTTAPR